MKKKSKSTDADKVIGDNIRRLRQASGISQAGLASVLGVTFQQIQKYESGDNRVSAANLYHLHHHFGVPLETFFKGLGDNLKIPAIDPALFLLCQRIAAVDSPGLKKKIYDVINILAA